MSTTNYGTISRKNKVTGSGKSRSCFLKDNYGLYLMLLPAMMFYVIFKYFPMYGILIAFQNYNPFKGVFQSQWVGLDVFREVLSQKTFWQILMNTLRLNLLSLIVGFPMPILFALMLNEIKRTRFKKAVQSVSYMPHFISWVIVYGMIVTFFSNDTGLVNVLLRHLGMQQVSFLTNQSWWLVIYIFSGIWKEMGWAAILYISALSAIDPSLYEASSMDGAGRFRNMWHITLPGIRSTIVIILILNLGRLMSIGFEQPYLLGNTMVSNVSNVLSTYIYNNGLVRAQYSFTSAVGLFQSVANFIMLILANFISTRLGEDGLYGGKRK